MKTLSECLSQAIYKRSSDPKHPDNAFDSDWQSGYFSGRLLDRNDEGSLHPITYEWIRRGKPDGRNKPFKHWKMGYHAGRFTQIEKENKELCPI